MNKTDTMDGNQAAAYASYAFTEVAAIYPITPSSPMAENVDEWAAHGRENLFGQPVRVVEMQSEAGAAGAMHGSLASGALTTTYTASQGLLLMIPNLYKMVGELLPGVLHVSARALATHALSIFGDHQDVMACRQTGAILLAASNVQEVMDMGFVAHLSALRARLPVLHFFDGFRTSHEIQKIRVIDYNDVRGIVDYAAIEAFRANSLSPSHPVIRGTAQNPDIYFQGREAQNPFFDRAADIVAGYMQELGRVTGRTHKPFDYYGAPDATEVIVAMGSVCDTVEETVDYLNANGGRTGAVKVHLYRPFCGSYFFDVLPPTVQKIAVLDRTKEPGAPGEPLYLDVAKLFAGRANAPLIVGGRFGLGSKDTRPSHILAVFDNLRQTAPRDRFTIGIDDDVTHLSLPEMPMNTDAPSGTVSCKFWGLGSDGTVGANKAAIKIIGNHTDLYAQGYFSYDSKKSGGTTVSHLRFGKNPIRSPYLVHRAQYIACHNKSFVHNYDILKGIERNGTFVLNCDWDTQELEAHLPASLKRAIAQNNIAFYTIDAVRIAADIGLGNRINMIMQAAFFKLINIIPIEDAARYLKESIAKTYGRKGQSIVDKNNRAVDAGISAMTKVTVPAAWAQAQDEPEADPGAPDFVNRIQRPMARLEGDDLPVSAFSGREDGAFPLGTTAYEKRGIAVMVPEWQPDKCIQCGMCSFVCPHATVRLFLLDGEEAARAPQGLTLRKATGKGLEAYQFRVQISPLDCTGCGNCADVCPTKDKALIMKPAEQQIENQAENWEFTMTLKEKRPLDLNTIKGSQLSRPLLEFNGACPGCGETPYIRLLTQLFGESMMIANATGCSSIWGASAPSIAYTTNAAGRGPAWANSLFEDNAEYGYGMYLGAEQLRGRLVSLAKAALADGVSGPVRDALAHWLDAKDDNRRSKEAAAQVISELAALDVATHPALSEIKKLQDYLAKRSFWIIGGDGWAYDIGYGGVDHVLSTSGNINLFVMDTEVYSNTGGQASKSTPASAVAKFAATGKMTRKKDLGMMAISYGTVYVAQIAMGANMNQTLKAIAEAESYPGPSLLIAYAPCVSHGIKSGMGTSILHEKAAVEAGYWHLYRYNPLLSLEGKNPFVLDSKDPKESYVDYIKSEVRYSQLTNTFPDVAEAMYGRSAEQARERYEIYKRMAERGSTQQPTT